MGQPLVARVLDVIKKDGVVELGHQPSLLATEDADLPEVLTHRRILFGRLWYCRSKVRGVTSTNVSSDDFVLILTGSSPPAKDPSMIRMKRSMLTLSYLRAMLDNPTSD